MEPLLPPATKLRQGNVFTPVCHSVQGGSATPQGDIPGQTPPGRPPARQTSPGQTPHWADRPPPKADTPLGRHPPAQCMLEYTPPCTVHAGIWSTSRRYASYWNAFL